MNKGLEFLQTTNWEFKEVANQQYLIKICPICYDERSKFYMSREGLWDCKICSAAGNLYQLKAKLTGLEDKIMSSKQNLLNSKPLSNGDHEDYIKNLWENKDALRYLKSRGFTKEAIEHFQLGLEDDWLMIPHIQDGKVWNYKLRNYKEKAFKRITGQPSILFNVDGINKEKKALVIVESETDCIAAWQMGIENVVALTTGAGTFLPEWVSYTVQFNEIYICLNSDEPGQKGAYNIAEKVGMSKCKNVILPVKDVNDYMKENSAEDFKTLIREAKRFSIKNITHHRDLLVNLKDWIEETGSVKGLNLPFNTINSYLKGFKQQDLIILSGDSGVGKTTLGLNLLTHFLQNNRRCLAIFLEGKINYYLLRMLSSVANVPTSVFEKKATEISNNEEKIRDETIREFSEHDFYIYTGPQAGLEVKELINLLNIAINLYDIDFVLIDNLQMFVKEDRFATQNVSEAMKRLKDITVDLNVPLLLISHITKPTDKDRKKVLMHDAKQSSTIYQVADIYLTIWNNKSRTKENAPDDMVLSIEKNRMGEGGVDIKMSFFKDIGLYSERIENKREVKKDKQEKSKEVIIETIEDEKDDESDEFDL